MPTPAHLCEQAGTRASALSEKLCGKLCDIPEVLLRGSYTTELARVGACLINLCLFFRQPTPSDEHAITEPRTRLRTEFNYSRRAMNESGTVGMITSNNEQNELIGG